MASAIGLVAGNWAMHHCTSLLPAHHAELRVQHHSLASDLLSQAIDENDSKTMTAGREVDAVIVMAEAATDEVFTYLVGPPEK